MYDLVHNKLHNCTPYIVYGDTDIQSDYLLIENKYLVLKVHDTYEHLSNKTTHLLRTSLLLNPYVKGIFKCDDDIIPNIYYLNTTMALLDKTNIDYAGVCVSIPTPQKSIWHYNKCSNMSYNKPIEVPACVYATGPIYYLSQKSIRMLMNIQLKSYFSEDVMIGYNMNKLGITPIQLPFYKNNIDQLYNHNFQNIDKRYKTLMVRLHGGLGNQLFQAATGYYMAMKYAFIPIFVYSKNLAKTHGEEFSTTIFSRFNVIFADNITYYDKCITLNEPNNNRTCFEYHGDNIINVYENSFLTGYFINKKYVENAGNSFIGLLQNPTLCNDLIEMYPDVNTSYFIHIRRGDYVGHPLYVINYDEYFTKAIAYIHSLDADAHFYIVSDDIEFCKTYDILKSINKTFIENMDTLHSIYFMSLCKKGGICSNSTFSGWATILNGNHTNNNKTVVFPKKWINTPHDIDIPFPYTMAI